jgi:8-oxo-dGTP diphosphatase
MINITNPSERSSLDNRIVQVGVQTIYKRNGLVLLGRRRKVIGDKTWALPGGRLEVGETILQCAVRELKEETGLMANSLKLSYVCDPVAASNFYLQLGVDVLSATGELKNCEPDFCDALDFFSLDNLPSPLFAPSQLILNAVRMEVFYLGNGTTQ